MTRSTYADRIVIIKGGNPKHSFEQKRVSPPISIKETTTEPT